MKTDSYTSRTAAFLANLGLGYEEKPSVLASEERAVGTSDVPPSKQWDSRLKNPADLTVEGGTADEAG